MLNLEDIWNIECMVAIGKPGNIKDLPEEFQNRETTHSDRLPLSSIVFEGKINTKPISLIN